MHCMRGISHMLCLEEFDGGVQHAHYGQKYRGLSFGD